MHENNPLPPSIYNVTVTLFTPIFCMVNVAQSLVLYILLLWLFALLLVILFCPLLNISFQWQAFLSNVFYLSSICVHTNNKKASKENRMALNNGRKPQCTTAVNWLLNGHDEHCTEENDAIFSWNSGVCLLFMKCFFCTAVQFFCKKKIETDWVFFQFIYLGIDHDHLMFYLNL